MILIMHEGYEKCFVSAFFYLFYTCGNMWMWGWGWISHHSASTLRLPRFEHLFKHSAAATCSSAYVTCPDCCCPIMHAQASIVDTHSLLLIPTEDQATVEPHTGGAPSRKSCGS